MDELGSKIALMWSLNTGFLLKGNRVCKGLRVFEGRRQTVQTIKRGNMQILFHRIYGGEG